MTDKAISRDSILISAGLAVCAFIALAGVFSCGFVLYDDPYYVTANPHVLGGLKLGNIIYAFKSVELGNWFPITLISHMVDVELFGVNPGFHHLTNLVLHISSSILLFYVLKGMSGALWRSAAAAALFALHPLHVGSVAWVAERKDMLSAFFGFLCLLYYARYAKGQNPELGFKKPPGIISMTSWR